MFPTQGPNFWHLSLLLLRYAPPAIAVVSGVVLCVRHARSRPHTARLVGIAIALLVCGGFAFSVVFLSLARSMGLWDPFSGVLLPLLLRFGEGGLQAAGLALLFWTAFLDETPLEYDPGPPVYRNDDGPAADD